MATGKKKGSERELTPKVKKFCREWIIDLSGKEAAKRAGFAPKSAEAKASQLLADPRVQKQIALLMRKREYKLDIRAERVLEEFAKVAFANITDYVELGPSGVRIKNLDDLPVNCQAAISAVSQNAQGGIRFKMYDKVAALEALGRHLSIFNDKLKVTGNITFAELAERARNAKRKRSKSTP